MEEHLFTELAQSIKEARAIAKGEQQATRRFVVAPPDAKAIREKIGLSQNEFAALMHVSIKTLQNWEQHRRQPTGPAAALLNLVASSPETVLKARAAAFS